MMISRRKALAALVCLMPCLAAAAPAWDVGLRASIWDDNYKLGIGGELGAIAPASANWDFGLHLDYSYFAPQHEDALDPVNELGGYVAAYYKPKIDQAFWLRIGPHIGYSHADDHNLDLGGDVQAVFKATPGMDFYATVIPSFFVGPNSQPMIRIGLGAQFHGADR